MNAIFAIAYIEAWKDFNVISTHDISIPVRRSKQLSYEDTGVGSWSFVGSNEPVRNEFEVMYEMFHMWNPDFFRLLYMQLHKLRSYLRLS